MFTQNSNALILKDLKYLFAYTIPLSVYLSFASEGIWTYTTVFYAFLVIPILDVLTGETTDNLQADDASYKKTKWVFDAMLYLNVPIVFGTPRLRPATPFKRAATRRYRDWSGSPCPAASCSPPTASTSPTNSATGSRWRSA